MQETTLKQNDLVSVVIPTYNCSSYIAKAITSVLNQTYSNIEIVVIDDGSIDDTNEVLKPFMNNIRYVYKANEGVSLARNVGIQMSQGKYIAFLDADDSWKPEKIEVQLLLFERYPDIGGGFSNFSKMKENGNIKEWSGIRRHYGVLRKYKKGFDQIFSQHDILDVTNKTLDDDRIDVYYGNIFHFLFLGNFIKTSSVILRKRVIKQVGNFDPILKTQEDYEYWLRISKEFYLAYIDYPLLSIRKREDQLTSDSRKEEIAQKSLEVIKKISDEAELELGKKVVNKRLAERNKHLALVYLGKMDNRKARDALRSCLYYDVFSLTSVLLLFWSFLPSKLAVAIKNNIKKISQNVGKIIRFAL